MIAPCANVEVHSRWQVQSCQRPAAAGLCAAAEEIVINVVCRGLEHHMRKLRTRTAARPRNCILCHGEILHRGRFVSKTNERINVSSGECSARNDLSVCL